MDDFRLNGVVKAIEKIYGIRFEPEEDDDYTFSQLGELNLDFRPSEAEPKQPPSSYLCVRYGKNIVRIWHNTKPRIGAEFHDQTWNNQKDCFCCEDKAR